MDQGGARGWGGDKAGSTVGGGGGLVSGCLCCIRYCRFHLLLLFARGFDEGTGCMFPAGMDKVK